MTREEAIKWLKTFKGRTGMAELSQAFEVAIKALEQEPCEDCISRQERRYRSCVVVLVVVQMELLMMLRIFWMS